MFKLLIKLYIYWKWCTVQSQTAKSRGTVQFGYNEERERWRDRERNKEETIPNEWVYLFKFNMLKREREKNWDNQRYGLKKLLGILKVIRLHILISKRRVLKNISILFLRNICLIFIIFVLFIKRWIFLNYL